MSECPSSSELIIIRKKLRKRKKPIAQPGMKGSLPNESYFEFLEAEGRLTAKWKILNSPIKLASFSDLSNLESLELDRLELGWLIADVIDDYAQQMLHSIPGPNEAMKEFSFYKKIADNWRHWSQVVAGHIV